MDDITSLIEMSEEDDCLLFSDYGGKQDLLSPDCSPLFQISDPSPSIGINEDYKTSSNDFGKSFVSEDGAEKENSDSNKSDVSKLKMDPQLKMKKKKGVDLRKSLAWDKAFFTEEGILNPLELATLNGNATSSVGLPEICEEDEGASDDLNSPVSIMSNDMQEEKYLSGNASIKPSITPNSHHHPLQNKNVSLSINSNRAILPSSDLKGTSSISLLPKPSAATKVKLPPKSTKLPAVASKQEPSSRVTSSGKLKKNDIVKPRQPKTSVTMSQQAKSRPTQINSNSGPLKSSISKPSQQLRKAEAPSQARIHSAKQKEKSTKETDNIRPYSFPAADCSVDHKAAPSILQKGRYIKNELAQAAKPSGLRMPSPSLGFFGQQSKADDGGIVTAARQKPPLPKKMPSQSSKGSFMSDACVNALKGENVHQDAELKARKEPKTQVQSQAKAFSVCYDVPAVEEKKQKIIKRHSMERNNQKCESEVEPLPETEQDLNVYSACGGDMKSTSVYIAHNIRSVNQAEEYLVPDNGPVVSEEALATTSLPDVKDPFSYNTAETGEQFSESGKALKNPSIHPSLPIEDSLQDVASQQHASSESLSHAIEESTHGLLSEQINSSVKNSSCEDLSEVIVADLNLSCQRDADYEDEKLIYSCDEGNTKASSNVYVEDEQNDKQEEFDKLERNADEESQLLQDTMIMEHEKQCNNDEECNETCNSSGELRKRGDIDQLISQMTSLAIDSKGSLVNEEEEEREELFGDLLSFYMELVTKHEDSAEMDAEEGMEQIPSESSGKKNGVVKPPSNAIPFSEEWLAAYEAAGEEAFTMKSGAVQNSPNGTALPEPNPWSPVNRNQTLGPFDCTKVTTVGMPSSSTHLSG